MGTGEGRGDELARLRRERTLLRDALVAIAGPAHPRAVERRGWQALFEAQRTLARETLRELGEGGEHDD